jgi:hypothetical protein
VTIPFLDPYGSLWIEGTTSSLDDTFVQTLKATVTRRDPVRGNEFKSVHQAYHLARSTTDLVGELVLERRFDEDRGVVTWMRSNFFGHTEPIAGADAKGKPGTKQTFALHEEWRVNKVLPNRYPGFNVAIKQAIVAGSERIRELIANPDGETLRDDEKADRTRNSGKLALGLLTLLKADVLPSDEVVKAGFDSLRHRIIKGAYECSLALMAMETLYAPPNERRLLLEGRIDKPIPRKPTPEDLALMEEWAKNILSYADVRIKNQAYLLRFNYVAGVGRYDNSVTQYCVLGLYSAYLCGVKISPTVWFAISKHMLLDQTEVDGPKIAFSTTAQRVYEKRIAAFKANDGKGLRTASSRHRIQPMGWPYVGKNTRTGKLGRPLTGSMTAAGLTNLTICEAVLRSSRKASGEVLVEMKRAIRSGFAWMLQNFTVRNNPNFHGHYLYYLYGLERAAELARVALIGNRDWYFEGAMVLTQMQRKNGAFVGGLVDDCFAVLFLKQAAPPLPSITGR